MQQHYLQDFKLMLPGKDKAGNTVGIPDYDWTADIYTSASRHPYRASFIGGVYTNARLGADGSSVVLVCDNHGLMSGRVMVDFHGRVPDADFPDGFCDVHERWVTDLVLTSSPAGCSLPEGETAGRFEAMLPFFKGEPFRAEDFTDEQWEALMKPAKDAAAMAAGATADAVKAAEAAREAAENAGRIGETLEATVSTVAGQEAVREGAEKLREAGEKVREEAEVARGKKMEEFGELVKDVVTAEPADKVLEGIESNIVTDALRKTEQALTESEQKQVLKNLGNPEFKLFVDMWNEACGNYGTYNAETGYFELNGLTDITYEQALLIYRESSASTFLYNYCYAGIKSRTLFPINNTRGNGSGESSYAFWKASNLEIINFGNSSYVSVVNTTFQFCAKLKEIKYGKIHLGGSGALSNLPALKEVRFYGPAASFSIAASSGISYDSILDAIEKAANTSTITITVHPDVYAKLTDETNEEWYALLELAASKNIQFATA